MTDDRKDSNFFNSLRVGFIVCVVIIILLRICIPLYMDKYYNYKETMNKIELKKLEIKLEIIKSN